MRSEGKRLQQAAGLAYDFDSDLYEINIWAQAIKDACRAGDTHQAFHIAAKIEERCSLRKADIADWQTARGNYATGETCADPLAGCTDPLAYAIRRVTP